MKDLHAWLDLPENRGKAVELAGRLGIRKAAVSLWRSNGVPLQHMKVVRDFTEGQVTIAAMVNHASGCREANATRRHFTPTEPAHG